MSAHLAVVPKIVRLIPMLSSNHPGEVVAAAEAVSRSLRATGCDWHDLAAAVERGWSVPAVHRSVNQSPTMHPWQRQARDLLALGVTGMRAWEREFLQSMSTWPFPPSAKQSRWLDAISAAMGDA